MKFIKLFALILLFSSYNCISQCNTNVSICTPGVAGPFNFETPSTNPSSCLDYWNGTTANYAYITLYITSDGPLNLLIDGNSTTGCLDVAIFDITGQPDPCPSLSIANEISCNYASDCDGCSEFGSTFPGCDSEVAAPMVSAGDVLMILVEDWSDEAGSFTLELGAGAQTGPGDPTINPAGPLSDTDPAFNMTAVNGGGTWSADCGACIDPVTGAFDPSVSGNGTFSVCYTLGAPPCDADDCIDVIVGPTCNMTGITANSNIICPSTTYTTTGEISFNNPPSTGTLTISDCNGNNQVLNPPFVSPIAYNLPNQNGDGLACNISAIFSANPVCTIDIDYVAPICPCNIDVFTVNIGGCSPTTNTYSVNGTLEFSMPPAAGTLIVSVDDGTNIYDTIINAVDFISPLAFSISGMDPNGSTPSITATFSADGGCTSTQDYPAPANCNCTAAIGTFNTSMIGEGDNDYVLCYGDQFNYESNNDWTAPADVDANTPGPPPINYEPGIGYLMYSCPPTIGSTPDNNPMTGDPCLEGLIMTGPGGLLYNDLNDLGWINTFPPGTFTDNIIYYVPVTMYDITNNWYSVAIEPCFELGPAVAVQYLTEIKTIEVEDCQAGSITSTVTGGLSELDGSNYTVVPGSLSPANASFVNTTAVHGGTITISGLTNGQVYSYDIEDNNGCPITVTGTFIGTEDPGFNYSAYTFCSADADPVVNITGNAGTFSYTVISDGPTLSLNTGTGAIDVSSSDPGTYEITYTTSDPICFEDSVVVITINQTPTVNTIPNQTVCDDTDFSTLIFTGTGSPSFDWTNTNTNIGLADSGTGDITAFTGTNNLVAQIAGLIEVTPSTTTCVGTATTFNLYVDPMDNASFEYVNGLTYCLTAPAPEAIITGSVGGTFSYSVNSGGPTLAINTTTGDIDLASSALGSYEITYLTAGACQQSSTLTLVITDAPEANFSFTTYCLNGSDPMPEFVFDDADIPFANIGNGGTFSEPTGNLTINPNTGEVDLDASTAGTYTITNTIDIFGCALSSATDDIVILELPTATMIGDANICPEGDLSALDIQVNFTSNGPWTVYYTMNNIPQSSNEVSPYIFNPTQFGVYQLDSVQDFNGCVNMANDFVTINSYPTPSVHPLNNFEACEGENISIDNFVGFEAGDIFHWTMTVGTDIGFGTSGTGNIGTFVATNPQTVTIEVIPESINGCFGPPVYFDIDINPVPVIDFTANKFNGCEPTVIEFSNLSSTGDEFVWTFGNGSTANGPNVSYTYENSGIYDVGLTVSTNEGCTNSLMEASYINITPTPVAAFAFSPDITDVSHTEIEFTNSSLDGDYYEWDFGDESPINNELDPIHTYINEPDQYHITLLVTNNNGLCRDSTEAYLTVNDILLYYVPNVFTPDGDEFNETFKPIFTSGFDPFNYHLMIFNRWGEVVFESYNAAIGWDGTYPQDGKLCQDGVYVWKIDFKETMSDKRHLVEGHVTLLK